MALTAPPTTTSAEHCGNRFRRTFEDDRFELAHVSAQGLDEEPGGDVAAAAERVGETHSNRSRVFLQPLGEVLAGLHRRADLDREHRVVVVQRSDGREIERAEGAGAHDVIAQQSAAGDVQVVCVPGALTDVGIGDAAAAARLVHDGKRGWYELVRAEGAFHGPRSVVVAAAGRRACDDLDIFLRRPRLCGHPGAHARERHRQYVSGELHG